MSALTEQGLASRQGAARGGGAARLPGLVPAAAIALVSGLAAWLYVAPQLAAERAATGHATVLAEVAPGDMPAALSTMQGGNLPLEAFRQRDRDCAHRLAWVSVGLAAGEQAGSVRLLSANYASPLFDLLPNAVRVAIPYPAPYESGRGELTVMATGGPAVVALTPPWRATQQAGGSRQIVTWQPARACAHANG